MKIGKTGLMLLWSIAATGCASQTNAIDELFAVDRAFSAKSGEIGAGPAFMEFAAEDVRAFPSRSTTLKGKVALAEWTSSWPKDRKVSWSPEEAVISRSGDLGYTWGYAEFINTTDDGGTKSSYSKYVTIWQRQSDGKWKWIADVGSSAPPPDER